MWFDGPDSTIGTSGVAGFFTWSPVAWPASTAYAVPPRLADEHVGLGWPAGLPPQAVPRRSPRPRLPEREDSRGTQRRFEPGAELRTRPARR